MTSRFDSTLIRYQEEHAPRLPFLAAAPPTDLPDLLARIEQIDDDELPAAIRFITDVKSARATPTLLRMLAEESPVHAMDIAHAVATIGGKRARPGLEKVVASARSQEIRYAAVYAICWLFDDESFPALLSLFQDIEEGLSVRVQAAEGMTYLIGGIDRRRRRWREVLEAFLGGLEDFHADIRFWSVVGLGTMRARQALPKLRKMANQDRGINPEMQWSVSDEARDAVRQITGQSAA